MKLSVKFKLYIQVLPLFCVLWYIFYNYVPWLLGRKPIESIEQYNLSNLPPPDWAVHFAINHGKAIYYSEKSQTELWLVSLIFGLVLLGLAVILGKAHKK